MYFDMGPILDILAWTFFVLVLNPWSLVFAGKVIKIDPPVEYRESLSATFSAGLLTVGLIFVIFIKMPLLGILLIVLSSLIYFIISFLIIYSRLKKTRIALSIIQTFGLVVLYSIFLAILLYGANFLNTELSPKTPKEAVFQSQNETPKALESDAANGAEVSPVVPSQTQNSGTTLRRRPVN